MNEFEILEEIKTSYQSILGRKLVGIYVHGSIAFKCFNWDKSDIDFLVVVNQTLNQKEKEELISKLLILDKSSPAKGLEMSVVLDRVCKPFRYPTPYELHFSNDHKEQYKENLSSYCKSMNGLDKDLAAHITVINQVGFVLCGKEISEVFEAVPRDAYVDSLMYDIEGVHQGILDAPVYFILNLCRVLAYLENELVLSKEQGGQWGVNNLPDIYSNLIEKALESYKTNIDFLENELAHDFTKYMLNRIEEKAKEAE